MSSDAPGPGLRILTQLARLRRDPLGVMREYHREFGDVVRLGNGALTVHLLGHPRHADHVLRLRHANYDRQTRSADAVRVVTGESLLTNDGDEWRRHRLLMQPLFNEAALATLPEIVIDATNAMIDRWSDEVDLGAEMMRLTSTIAGRTFFGTEIDPESETSLARLMPLILEETYERSTAIIALRRPSRRFASARDEIRATVERVLARGDSPLLARLRELDADELRNETLALLLAGHETTANALAWTFACIRPDDPPREAVLEAMRLYPPIWILERRAIEDDAIDGFTIPAGSIVYLSPYIFHRHADFWNDPERFDPSRFPDAERNPAYLPFGAGPHRCLGAAFAMIEAPLVVETVRARCALELIAPVEEQAWITLRPRDGVRMRVVNSDR